MVHFDSSSVSTIIIDKIGLEFFRKVSANQEHNQVYLSYAKVEPHFENFNLQIYEIFQKKSSVGRGLLQDAKKYVLQRNKIITYPYLLRLFLYFGG